MNISEIIIGERHRRDMGDLAALAESISTQGLLQPIGVTTENELVFGERRLRAVRDILGWTEIDVRVVDVTSIVEGEHDENELREAFKPSEKVAIGRAVEAEIGKRQGQRTDVELSKNICEVVGRTDKIAASKSGFGNETTYRQAKSVVDEGIPELVEKMDVGDASVSAASIIAKQPAEVQKRIIAEQDLAKAAAELRRQEKIAKEAEALPKAKPLTPEERTEREEVFGTQASRSLFMDVLGIAEKVASFPEPEDMYQSIPPALEHTFDVEAFREVARWFDAFCNAYDDKESARVAAQ